jgi:hypothetical protein
MRGIGFVAGGARIDDPHDDATDEKRPRHDGDATEMLLAHFVERQGDDGSKEEGDEGKRYWMVFPGAVAAFAAWKALDEADNTFEIKKKKCEDGADLNNDGVHLPIRVIERDMHGCFSNTQMRGGTDGKKLGQALNDSQEY